MNKKYIIYSLVVFLTLFSAGCVFVASTLNENVNINGGTDSNVTADTTNVVVATNVINTTPSTELGAGNTNTAVNTNINANTSPVISPIQKIQEKVTSLATNIAQSTSKPSVLLAVPFASQAPFGVWDALHEDACEEAAVIMAHNYVKKLPLNNQIMEDGLQSMIAWEETQGFGLSITMSNVQLTMNKFLGNTNTRLIDNPTIEDLKNELSAGNPIVVPAAGRDLGNPYFSGLGPIYHMYTLIGYDDARKEFITNDPGTKRGEKYRYSYDTVISTMHDWNGATTSEEIRKGKKVVLVVEAGQ